MANELPENLRYFNEEARAIAEGRRTRSFDGGGGGGYDGSMDERVQRLEKFAEEARGELRAIDVRLTKIETKLDSFATKEDVKTLSAELHRELHATTWKIVGTFALLCGAVFWIARNVEPPRPASPAVPAAQAAPAQPPVAKP